MAEDITPPPWNDFLIGMSVSRKGFVFSGLLLVSEMEVVLVQCRSGVSLGRVGHDSRAQELGLGVWPNNTQ